jgi:hypothetical protein
MGERFFVRVVQVHGERASGTRNRRWCHIVAPFAQKRTIRIFTLEYLNILQETGTQRGVDARVKSKWIYLHVCENYGHVIVCNDIQEIRREIINFRAENRSTQANVDDGKNLLLGFSAINVHVQFSKL